MPSAAAFGSKHDIDKKKSVFFESMGECFWELYEEFEGSVQTAIEEGEINCVDRESLFKVFGHFHFVVTVEGEEIEYDVGVDPDEFMYSKLGEYIALK